MEGAAAASLGGSLAATPAEFTKCAEFQSFENLQKFLKYASSETYMQSSQMCNVSKVHNDFIRCAKFQNLHNYIS